MKKILQICILIIGLSLTSCATIIGGSRYNAHIQVANNPSAQIYYQGNVVGTGYAVVKVKRKEADKFEFFVQQEGKSRQTYRYHSRVLRGGALAGTILGWTGIIPPGIPLPWGVAVDGITGSWWKPDVSEKGLQKQDYKNFRYIVNYGSDTQNTDNLTYMDVLYLKNGGMIKGDIIEQEPNKSVKIKTKDGNIFVYKIEEISKISKERP